MPDFQNPSAFLLLLAIPLLYLFRTLGFFSQLSFVITLSDWNGKDFSWKSKNRTVISIISSVCAVLAFLFTVIAIADPVFYRQERVYTSRGTDICFVIDTSPSMAAKDMSGFTRLDAAKNAVKDLINENPGATFGIIEMGEESAITVPPTIDRKIFLERLESIQLGKLGSGTAIGTGIATAVFHLNNSRAPKKCIVLITDGENNAGAIHPETAAELAHNNNITVYTLGVGTSGSVPIDYIDPNTKKTYTGFLNSTFDSSFLRQLSKIGDGRFFEIQSLNDFSLALSMIIKNQAVVQTFHSKTISYKFYDRLLFIAGILSILAWFFRRIVLTEFI